MRGSAETIYKAFYLEPKGQLKDLGLSLPSGRTKRRTRTSVREQSPRRRFVDEFCSIDQRPAEANDRAVPGHWEGDLILGKENKSAVLTLLERTTRFSVLGHLPGRHDAQSVLDSLKDTVQSLDQPMRSSITWDQEKTKRRPDTSIGIRPSWRYLFRQKPQLQPAQPERCSRCGGCA